jgi:hypothetical protein
MILSTVNVPGRRSWAATQIPVIIGLLAVAVSLVVAHRAYQTWEIELAGVLLRLLTSSGVYVDAAHQDVYFVAAPEDHTASVALVGRVHRGAHRGKPGANS